MLDVLQGKRVVLGVTGSIAAYKAADLTSKLAQAGALVDVILTAEAARFVTPLTFTSLTHRPVLTELFDATAPQAIEHVALANAANLIVVAPATANVLAKLAHGLADDLLTCTLLATAAPVIVAPAMDGHMYDNPATQANLAILKQRGITIVGPASGHLASGLSGKGRLVELADLLGAIRATLGRKGDLAGRRIVVSAGGTQEPIDPVRVITNRSSGKMGYALAEAARDRGALVTLVTAANLPDPAGLTTHHVETVAQMRDAVLAATRGADAVIMAAAVSDYRAAEVSEQKLKKSSSQDGYTLELAKNADFFLEIPAGVLRVGFAAESQDLLRNAREKLEKKGLALIVANDITEAGSGFGADSNRVVIIDRQGHEEALPLLPKGEVANRILDRMLPLLPR